MAPLAILASWLEARGVWEYAGVGVWVQGKLEI